MPATEQNFKVGTLNHYRQAQGRGVLPDGRVLPARLPGRTTRDTLFADVTERMRVEKLPRDQDRAITVAASSRSPHTNLNSP